MRRKLTIAQGDRFGRWTVVGAQPECSPVGRWRWLCRCDCGTERNVLGFVLNNGNSRSCGCLKVEVVTSRMTKHGHTVRPEYKSWRAMLSRCLDPSHRNYKNYGGRGVIVAPEWESYERFLADVGPRPTPKHWLERIDNDGPYAPCNVCWATQTQQARNKRTNVLVTHDGRTMPVSAWAEVAGLDPELLRGRLKKGWSIERALREPVRRWQHKR
jgi:hypothetical protein